MCCGGVLSAVYVPRGVQHKEEEEEEVVEYAYLRVWHTWSLMLLECILQDKHIVAGHRRRHRYNDETANSRTRLCPLHTQHTSNVQGQRVKSQGHVVNVHRLPKYPYPI